MSMLKSLGKVALSAVLAMGLTLPVAHAQEFEMRRAENLDELLRLVRDRALFESQVNRQRDQEFTQNRNEQQQMLTDARRTRTQEENRSERLEATFQENERLIGQLQEQLDTRLGTLRELFGVLQQVAGDTVGVFNGSIVSAQFPGRADEIQALAQRMGQSSRLASIEEIEGLWIALQQQMTETGRVVRFPGTVIEVDGELQRWKPAACSPFPLDAGQIAATLCLNQGERRRLGGRLEHPADLIERLRRGSATMIAEVFKRRVLGDMFDCRRATTQVRIAGAWHGSRALENVDADNLRRAMRSMGWPETANESYGQRLLRALQPATAARSQRSP